MIWKRTSPERVILSFLFLIKFLKSVLQRGHHRYIRDVPSACFRCSPEELLLGNHHHRSPLPDLVPLTTPPGARSRRHSHPGLHWLFQKTPVPTSGAGFLNPPSIYQLPQKLRAFKVSSLHLVAYVGSGGCRTLWKRLPCETGLQAFYITADGVSVDFYMLSKQDPDIIHYNDSLCSSLRLLCKDTLRRLNSSELLLLLLIAVLHIRVYISVHVGVTARHTYSLKPWNFSWKMHQSFPHSHKINYIYLMECFLWYSKRPLLQELTSYLPKNQL